ncbi:hypothetical protein [Curtobacterium sp. ME12]|uniref:hypothetical protein n=1 Tax=Curtobacterium sp. ME12 TaxID=2744253 RepID=UPI0015F56908|nr:hypothetical protein [Curtobacterium sp. ME12]
MPATTLPLRSHSYRAVRPEVFQEPFVVVSTPPFLVVPLTDGRAVNFGASPRTTTPINCVRVAVVYPVREPVMETESLWPWSEAVAVYREPVALRIESPSRSQRYFLVVGAGDQLGKVAVRVLPTLAVPETVAGFVVNFLGWGTGVGVGTVVGVGLGVRVASGVTSSSGVVGSAWTVGAAVFGADVTGGAVGAVVVSAGAEAASAGAVAARTVPAANAVAVSARRSREALRTVRSGRAMVIPFFGCRR